MVEWLIYSPDTTHSVRAALEAVGLVAIVEVLYPREIAIGLSTTPIALIRETAIRETAEFGLVLVELVQFILAWQIPAAAEAGAVLLRLVPIRTSWRIFARHLQIAHVVGAHAAHFIGGGRFWRGGISSPVYFQQLLGQFFASGAQCP